MSDSILDRVIKEHNIKTLNSDERKQLCIDIREFLIDSVSKTGGHLASNLGAVELTVALHTVFDMKKDKFVWDVGHQTYVHKILTGRKNKFHTLRKYEGLSGFPKTIESSYDVFNTGHSSTSISAALGIARARDLSHEDYCVGAIFGDGALTGGMMYEAMNDAGRMKTPLILILNDNNMSISKSVGSISKYLRRIRINPGYSHSKQVIEKILPKIPIIGNSILHFTIKFKLHLRRILLQTTMFENFGFEYLGPVDGNDVDELITLFMLAKQKCSPVFLHVCTKKGKGYLPAEQNPELFHGVGPFDKDSGIIQKPIKDYSRVFGDKLFDIARSNDNVVALTCAMPVSTGIEVFSKYFKDRFFDVGIAEQHGVTMSAGLAISGYIPVIPLYSSFLQRAYDQILHDVCLQNLHVVFPIDRAGIVGADGETHHGLFDISFLSSMPNMSVLSPSAFCELEEMLDYAINKHNGPIAIRYPRGNVENKKYIKKSFKFGRANLTLDGEKAVIFATGRMVNRALEVADITKNCRVVNVATISPLPEKDILSMCLKNVVIIEDGIENGGLGSMICELLIKNKVYANIKCFAFPKIPIVHGSISELDKKYALDAQSIAEYIKKM